MVYLVDCSGSMIATFDRVKAELLRSIASLDEDQQFHVIFYSAGKPLENKPRKLVPATETNKQALAEWVQKIQPYGSTEVLPAIRRAGLEIQKAKPKQAAVFLLADGRFQDNERVLAACKEHFENQPVAVHTFLFGSRVPEAVEAMETIAENHGGKYTFVSTEK